MDADRDPAPTVAGESRPGAGRALGRILHAAFVLALAVTIVAPPLPDRFVGAWSSELAAWELVISIKQAWQMYSPNPQRAQTYMNLSAVYEDKREVELEETAQEREAWHTHFAWDKTRIDIWRQYANFNPRQRNQNRIWYLRGVCVREARKGAIPNRIVMYAVRRRFTPPHEVLAGKPGLGAPRRELVTVQYCKTPQVLEMIERDKAAHGLSPREEP